MTRPGRRAPAGPASAPGGTGRLDVALSVAGLQARAVFRLLASAAIAVVLLTRADDNPQAAATIVPVVVALYVLVSTASAWPSRGAAGTRAGSRRADVVRALLDVAAVAAIAASVNEPRVIVLLLLCAIPLGYGLTLPAATVAMLTAVAVVGCVLVWATTGPFGTVDLDAGTLLLLAFALAWCGLVACLIAVEREHRARRIAKLSGSVRDMLGQALRAESSERARVADLLHDDVLQLLLATRHDISDAIDGDLDLLPEARAGIEAATRRLRETIVALRDEGSGDESLGVALRGLADDPTRPRAIPVAVHVDPAIVDERHPVLVAVARDAVRDAEATSAPTRMSLRVTAVGDELLLVLEHDDRRHALGVASDPSEALAEIATRVRAVDGVLEVRRGPAGVRTMTVRLPARPPHREPDDVPAPGAPLEVATPAPDGP